MKETDTKQSHRLNARYGLSHDLEIISETTYRAFDVSRVGYDRINESGKFEGVSFIDFDGGPFLQIGGEIPGVPGKAISEFSPCQIGDSLQFIDIILKDL